VQHDQRKKKDRLAAAFPNLDLVGAGAADELSRSVKLEHTDTGQRDRRPLQLYASRSTESRVKSVQMNRSERAGRLQDASRCLRQNG
jgi:hypothetical protein